MTDKPVHAPFLKFFLPLAVALIAGVLMLGQTEIESELTRLKSQETLNVGLGAGTLTGQIESISRDLSFLSSHSALRRAINAPTDDNLASLATDFANFSRSKGIYDQLRWLDETGMEIVRVDNVQGEPVVFAADKLQNKGDRYFFGDSFKLQPGEVFISPLDLNIEHDKIEIPYKPMVRVATPVVDDQGKKRGIVILNYYGREMLQAFATATTATADHIMVVNGEGYWLKSPQPDDEWGFMFKRPEMSLAARAPEAWQKISAEDFGQHRLADGLWTWQTVYPLVAGQRSSTGAADAFMLSRGEIEIHQYAWKSVAHLSADVLDAASRSVWNRLAGVGAILLATFGFVSLKLAQRDVALRESEDTFRSIFETNSDGILLLDSKTSFVKCNQSALDLLKMSREQLLSLTLDQISTEFQPCGRRSSEYAPEMIASAYRTGFARYDWVCVTSEGSEVIVEICLTPIAIEGQAILHVTWRDITERKQVQLALEQKTIELQTKNSLLDSLSKTDPLTRIANRRMTQQVIEQEIDRFKRYKKPS